MGKSRSATVGDVLFNDQLLTHLLQAPLVRGALAELTTDFNRAYAPMMAEPIDLKADEDLIESLSVKKTELFQAFIVGCLEAHNPEGRFGQLMQKLSPKPEPEGKKLIL